MRYVIDKTEVPDKFINLYGTTILNYDVCFVCENCGSELYWNLPYSHSMYLKGFTPTQIYSAFKQTQRRKQKDKKDKKREQSILEKETFALIEKMLGVAVDEAMKDIFKDWK